MKTISLRLEEELDAALEALCAAQGREKADLVRQIVSTSPTSCPGPVASKHGPEALGRYAANWPIWQRPGLSPRS